jgi:hypothetical protein
MRSFVSRGGHFYLNGERTAILGSNMVHEWLWGEGYYTNRDGAFSDYLFQRAKGMNVRCVRTHTNPKTP